MVPRAMAGDETTGEVVLKLHFKVGVEGPTNADNPVCRAFWWNIGHGGEAIEDCADGEERRESVINDRTARVVKTIVTIVPHVPLFLPHSQRRKKTFSNLKMALIHPTLPELAQQEETYVFNLFHKGKNEMLYYGGNDSMFLLSCLNIVDLRFSEASR